MIRVLLLALAFPPGSAAVTQGNGFDAALELVARGRYAEAIEAAAQDPDPLRQRQASVHARHHAGDLRGALAEARAGLREQPGEPWLLEQAAFLAVSLNEGRLALDLSEELLRLGSGNPNDGAARQRAADLHRQAAAAQIRWAARRSALQRAQGVAGVGLLLTLLALAWLARPTPPPTPLAAARTP